MNVSLYLVGSPPGSGAELHSHPCEEVFVEQEGVAANKVRSAVLTSEALKGPKRAEKRKPKAGAC